MRNCVRRFTATLSLKSDRARRFALISLRTRLIARWFDVNLKREASVRPSPWQPASPRATRQNTMGQQKPRGIGKNIQPVTACARACVTRCTPAAQLIGDLSFGLFDVEPFNLLFDAMRDEFIDAAVSRRFGGLGASNRPGSILILTIRNSLPLN